MTDFTQHKAASGNGKTYVKLGIIAYNWNSLTTLADHVRSDLGDFSAAEIADYLVGVAEEFCTIPPKELKRREAAAKAAEVTQDSGKVAELEQANGALMARLAQMQEQMTQLMAQVNGATAEPKAETPAPKPKRAPAKKSKTPAGALSPEERAEKLRKIRERGAKVSV